MVVGSQSGRVAVPFQGASADCRPPPIGHLCTLAGPAAATSTFWTSLTTGRVTTPVAATGLPDGMSGSRGIDLHRGTSRRGVSWTVKFDCNRYGCEAEIYRNRRASSD